MNQADICKLLRDARHSVNLSDLLPAPFVVYTGDHDTGCQPFIYARAEGLPQVLVWYGSVWYSSAYEFNDKGKVLGCQPGCEWAKPVLEKFFNDVNEAWATVQAERGIAKAQHRVGAERQHKNAVSQYAAMVSNLKP